MTLRPSRSRQSRSWRTSLLPALSASLTWLVFLGLLNAFPHSAQQAWITVWPCLVFTGGAWIITRFGQRDHWRVLGVGILETFGLRPFDTELWIFYATCGLFLIATLIYTAALVLTSPRPKTFV